MGSGLFKGIIANWSLERKCLLLLGLALLVSIFLAFFVVQAVAALLVMETTRRTAKDVAETFIFGEHVEAFASVPQSNQSSTDSVKSSLTSAAVLRELRKDMLDNTYSFQLLRLDDGVEFEDLGGKIAKEEIDLAAMYRIEARWNQFLSQAGKNPDSKLTSPKPSSSTTDLLAGPSRQEYFYEEYGPVSDQYFYYHPIQFRNDCMVCHAPINSNETDSVLAGAFPLRVLRVQMPYAETRLWTIWSYSIMLAIGITTLAMSLFSTHYILKRLVIRPLRYLRDVSDEVSRGNLQLRSEIDTNDEFYELSDAFNRMLRHLTETQVELQSVNSELDRRVDQLASLNLQLYEANRLKSDFLASMSHELRTPLNSILGFSDVLQSFDTLTDKQKRYAANIQKSGRLLLEMINDILDLAKVEAGKMEVRTTYFDVIQLVQGQCDVVRNLAEEKNLDLQVEIGIATETTGSNAACSLADKPLAVATQDGSQQVHLDHAGHLVYMVRQDQTKLQQIMTNLISNAIKFTPEGGFITVTLFSPKPEWFAISVEDTGVGIAEHDFEKIFEKFRQVRSNADGDALSREYSGTGLGLSIVRELCRLLGGDITLESQLGKGSTFCVTLPQEFTSPVNPNDPEEASSIPATVRELHSGHDTSNLSRSD